jgi:hypothetical protein
LGLDVNDDLGRDVDESAGVGAWSTIGWGNGWGDVVVPEVEELVPGGAWERSIGSARRGPGGYRACGTAIEHGRSIQASVSARVTRLFWAPARGPACRRSARATLQPSTDARPVLRARTHRLVDRSAIPLDAWRREARQVAAAMLSQDRVSGVSPLRKRPRLGSNSSSRTAQTIQTAKVRALGDAERVGVPATEGRGTDAEGQMMIRERVERPSVSLDARDRAEMTIRSNRRVTRRTTD